MSLRIDAAFGFHSPLKTTTIYLFPTINITILMRTNFCFIACLAPPKVLPLVHLLCAATRDKEEHFLRRQRPREAKCCALDLIEQIRLFKYHKTQYRTLYFKEIVWVKLHCLFRPLILFYCIALKLLLVGKEKRFSNSFKPLILGSFETVISR